MQAVIIAGGNGVRLFPYTSVIPKPLLPLDEMPIIEIIVKQLAHHGFTKISVAAGYLGELIRTYLSDGSRYGIQIDYAFESKPLGTIAPLTLINDLEPTVLVMNADLLTDLDYRALLAYHKEKQAAATVGMYRKKIKSDYGVIVTNGDLILKRILEKPEFTMDVSMGIYTFDSRIFKYFPQNQRVDFPDFLNLVVQRGEKVIGYPFEGFWLDIGQHCDYLQATKEFNEYREILKID